MRIITELLSNTSGSILLMDLYGNFVIKSSLQRAKFVFIMDQGRPVGSEWLVINKINARARKGLVLGPMGLLLSFSCGHVVGNFLPHEALVLGGTNSFPGNYR